MYDSGYHFSVLLGTQRKSSILFKSSINPFKLSSWFRFSDCRIFSFVLEYFRYVSLSSQILLSFCFKFWSSSICDFFWFISSWVGFRFSEILLKHSPRFWLIFLSFSKYASWISEALLAISSWLLVTSVSFSPHQFVTSVLTVEFCSRLSSCVFNSIWSFIFSYSWIRCLHFWLTGFQSLLTVLMYSSIRTCASQEYFKSSIE